MMPCMLERDEHNANVSLLLAAPELLEALQAITASYDETGCDDCGVVDGKVIQKALFAIAKALGNESQHSKSTLSNGHSHLRRLS